MRGGGLALMSNIFYLPRVQSLPGAKLNFYVSGTSTRQNTYTDIDLTVPHANPVVADAEGYFEPIYLDPSLPNYRVTLTTSADVTIDGPIDDVPSTASSGQLLRLVSSTARIILVNSSAAVDEKKWVFRVNGSQLVIGTLPDDESAGVDVITFNRVGTSAFALDFNTNQQDTMTLDTIPVMPSIAVKASATGRASTTTLANDSDLTLQLSNGGHYAIDCLLRVVGNGASGAGGFKRAFTFSGTIHADGLNTAGQAHVNASGSHLAMADGTAAVSYATITSSGVGDYERITGYLHASTSGILRLQWAQNSSNAATTNLMAGSYMRVRRLSAATS
jgi:hypothetical protein